MKKAKKIFYFFLLLCISTTLIGCSTKLAPADESMIIDKANKVLSDFGLSGKISLEYDKYDNHYSIYKINILCDAFSLKNIYVQNNVLTYLANIRTTQSNIMLTPVIISNQDTYTYAGDGFKNGVRLFALKPNPNRISTTSSSSSSSSPYNIPTSSSKSTCDILWDNLILAYTISGNEDTELTHYYMQQMSLHNCPPR